MTAMRLILDLSSGNSSPRFCNSTIDSWAAFNATARLASLLTTLGEILLNGQDTLKMSARELQQIRGGVVSYVFQEPGASLNPVFRVGAQQL